MLYASPYPWNQLPSSFRRPYSVHSPPGSPHPAHITSSHLPPSLSLPRPFIPDLKLISFTNPFLHSLSSSVWTAFTDLEPVPNYTMGHWRLFVLVSTFYVFLFQLACARLSWQHSAFQSMLNFSIVSYRIVMTNICANRFLHCRSQWPSPMTIRHQIFHTSYSCPPLCLQ